MMNKFFVGNGVDLIRVSPHDPWRNCVPPAVVRHADMVVRRVGVLKSAWEDITHPVSYPGLTAARFRIFHRLKKI